MSICSVPLFTIVTAGTVAAPDRNAVYFGTALMLMTLIALLLAMLFIIVVMVTWRRTRRSRAPRKPNAAQVTDAWSESARRLQPLDGGPRKQSR